ncbi:hypothetical protein BJY21_003960 [Kineosphaera limosa]|uniref:PIN domain-containing protein n=1 Tax=Kineosphaera limosa NBRC 100340 TaxID=1184609 RepID=K6WC80_9MICO|nr:hypothetical protein [Kineosphaera limosa]NYE02776.1 hypothetical protein [Kineosphaera limosa]GAB96855.1 hypothetical protein KILIM_050_00370 [Kineosphaera limosa NBRC 100340]
MTASPICVFLDANVLAKPVTRTLLMVGGPPSGFRTVWSRAAEQEAHRHMRPRAISPAAVRRRFGGVLGPTGAIAGRFSATGATDRQILADAEAASACFLVTEDVDDFAEPDLVEVGVSAVNPDLFLSVWVGQGSVPIGDRSLRATPGGAANDTWPVSRRDRPTTSTAVRSACRSLRHPACTEPASAARDPV